MILGLIATSAFGYLSEDPELLGWSDMQTFYIVQAVQIVLAAFLTWRIYTGKGRFASILLLIWIVFEVGSKVASTELPVGLVVMWLFAILSIVHSIRGSWAVRKYQ